MRGCLLSGLRGCHHRAAAAAVPREGLLEAGALADPPAAYPLPALRPVPLPASPAAYSAVARATTRTGRNEASLYSGGVSPPKLRRLTTLAAGLAVANAVGLRCGLAMQPQSTRERYASRRERRRPYGQALHLHVTSLFAQEWGGIEGAYG